MRPRLSGLIAALLVGLAALAPAGAPAATAATSGPAAPFFTLPDGQGAAFPTTVGSLVFFFGSTEFGKATLWVTDGTAAGTKQLASGLGRIKFDLLGSAGKTFFFITSDLADTTAQLWASDGTAAGTGPVHTFTTDPGSAFSVAVGRPITAGDLAFFTVSPYSHTVGTDAFFDTELWRSDGTAAGTFALTARVKRTAPSIPTYTGHYAIDGLAGVGDAVVFDVHPSGAPVQLWRSDGTLAGTQLALVGLNTCSQPVGPTAAGRWVFCANSDSTKLELWSVGAGASDLQRVAALDGWTYVFPIGVLQGRALFEVQDGAVLRWAASSGVPGDLEATTTKIAKTVNYVRALPDRLVAITVSTWNGQICYDFSDGRPANIFGAASAAWCYPTTYPPGAQYYGAMLNLQRFGDGLATRYGSEVWYTDGSVTGTRPIFDNDWAGYWDVLGSVGEKLLLNRVTDAGATELWTLPSGPGGFVRAQAAAAGPPSGTARIPLVYGTNGLGTTGATLTLTLPAGVTYLGDTSGVTPTVAGQQVTWQLPALARLQARALDVQVGLPSGAVGTSLTATATIATAEPSVDTGQASAEATILLADQIFLPLAPADTALLR